MIYDKFREAWKRRVRHHLIKNAGKEDWRVFVKALCMSWDSCREFPYDCKFCFDNYFNAKEIIQQVLED